MLKGLFVWLAVVGNTAEPQWIEWDAAEGCPSQAAVLQSITEWLGHTLTDYPRAVVTHARIEEAHAGYRMRLSIEVDGVSEQHEIAGPDCEQLGWDAALLIASAVDPFALGPPMPRERQLSVTPVVVQYPSTRSQVVTTSPAAPIVRERVAPVHASDPVIGELYAAPDVDRPEPLTRRRSSAVAGSLGVAGTTFVGVFPQIGGGVALEGGLEHGLFGWQFTAAGWFGGSFRATGTNVGADLWAASATTGPCVTPNVRRVHFAACAVAGAGTVAANAVQTTGAGTLARPWAYAGADLRVSWSPRPRAGLFVGLAVLPALARPAWTVSDPDTSYRIPPVAGLLRFGVELRQLGSAR